MTSTWPGRTGGKGAAGGGLLNPAGTVEAQSGQTDLVQTPALPYVPVQSRARSVSLHFLLGK